MSPVTKAGHQDRLDGLRAHLTDSGLTGTRTRFNPARKLPLSTSSRANLNSSSSPGWTRARQYRSPAGAAMDVTTAISTMMENISVVRIPRRGRWWR